MGKKIMNNTQIAFRLPEAMKELIQERAEKENLDMSLYCLWKILPDVYEPQIRVIQGKGRREEF